MGSEHADLDSVLAPLARTYLREGKHAEAEAMLLRQLQIQEKAYGEHMYTAFTLQFLASIYRDTGDYKQSETYYLRALEMQERILEPQHVDTIKTLQGYALLLRKLGRDVEAEALEARIKPQEDDQSLLDE